MKIDEDRIVLHGVTYWRLYTKCPVCFNNARDVPSSFWYHKQCGGDIYIGNNAKLYCEKCGWSIHVAKAKFNCPIHCKCEEETVEPSTCLHYEFGASNIGPSIICRAGIPWLKDFLKNYDE